jgi:uncharacterized protein (DUF1778 family)
MSLGKNDRYLSSKCDIRNAFLCRNRSATETSQESQEHILHSAASILKHDIQSFVINNDDYPNANEVSLAISVEKMSQSILKFICWLIDEKAYKAASEPYAVPIDKIRKILGITCVLDSLEKFMWPTNVLSQTALTLILTYPLQQ